MITDRHIDQAYSDLRSVCGGVREDYFGLLYVEQEHDVPREKAVNQIAFGGNDYGLDGFHFDRATRNLYLFQFKYSESHALFKDSLLRKVLSVQGGPDSPPNQDIHPFHASLTAYTIIPCLTNETKKVCTPSTWDWAPTLCSPG